MKMLDHNPNNRPDAWDILSDRWVTNGPDASNKAVLKRMTLEGFNDKPADQIDNQQAEADQIDYKKEDQNKAASRRNPVKGKKICKNKKTNQNHKP